MLLSKIHLYTHTNLNRDILFLQVLSYFGDRILINKLQFSQDNALLEPRQVQYFPLSWNMQHQGVYFLLSLVSIEEYLNFPIESQSGQT